MVYYDKYKGNTRKDMKPRFKTRSVKHKSSGQKSGTPKVSPAIKSRASCKAYGDKVSLCINTDCVLRKKAGGCLGFEGCPGFKAR